MIDRNGLGRELLHQLAQLPAAMQGVKTELKGLNESLRQFRSSLPCQKNDNGCSISRRRLTENWRFWVAMVFVATTGLGAGMEGLEGLARAIFR